ncbi:MAG: hypothetical protein ACOX8I_02610 [Bacillota bacterium]
MQSTRHGKTLIIMISMALLTALAGSVQAQVNTPAQSQAQAKAQAKPTIYKYETVYATLTSSGAVADITVVDWLRIYGTGRFEILDPTKLTGLQNLRGPETPARTSEGYLWKVDSKGVTDIQYSGKTDLPLPLGVELSYKLNGKAAKAEEIVGRSGKVEVVVKIMNKLGPYTQENGGPAVYMPMTVVSSVEIPMDNCWDVTSDATMASLIGSKMRYQWLNFPNPAAEMRFAFESNRIELAAFDILLLPQMPTLVSQFNFTSQLIPLQESLEQLDIALGDALSGSHQLYKGQNDLYSGLATLEKGLGDLLTLSSAHYEILRQINEQLRPFSNDKLAQVSSGFNMLSDGLRQAYDGTGQLQELNAVHQMIVGELKKGLESINTEQLTQIPGAVDELENGLKELEDGLRLLAQANEGQATVIQKLYEANLQAVENLKAFEKKHWILKNSKEYKEMKASVELQIEVLKALIDGGTIQDQRIPGLKETAAGALTMANEVQGARNAVHDMNLNTDEMLDGLSKMQTAIDILAEGGEINGRNVPGLDTANSGLKSLAEGLNTILTSVSSFMGQIGEFMGLGVLRDAIAAMLNGGVIQGQTIPDFNTMVSGLKTAKSGVAAAIDGSKQLGKGQLQLSEGIGKIRTEGVVPIRTAVKEGVEEMSRQNAAMGMMTRKMQSYDTFAGKPQNAMGEVRFMFRIPAVKP